MVLSIVFIFALPFLPSTTKESSNPTQLMSSPSPLVWFLLLDSAIGLPYKGTSADYVSLLLIYVIAQFRDGMSLSSKFFEVSSRNYLKHIPSSVLVVYKNKFSFNKRKKMERKSY
ncbi:hypothetical protein BC833DRAFT_600104 [Globomyces pollinis-pini]|nr:hypothetical protein BC833DRAFT_600104 [Globomyces pollinis-pini]